MYITRDDIINEAYMKCMTEMYAKAQPSANFSDLLEGVKNGTIVDTPYDKVFERYYLSYEEFHYILDKYIGLYGMSEKWTGYLETVEKYFTGEGRKDIWIAEKTDEDGHRHPGYRSSEAVPHIKDTISKIISEYYGDSDTDEISKKISNKVLSYVENCKNYYRYDREEQNFRVRVSLGCSPTSNKNSVFEYWKKQGKDIEIVERNPRLLWDMDYYGDEFEEVMIDTYGENWLKKTWNDYYNSKEGKKKLVYEWMRQREEFKNMYINNDDNGDLIIIDFTDSSVSIPIDDFIKENKIKGYYYDFRKKDK